MKKLNNVLAVSVLAFGLVACGGDDIQPTQPIHNNNGVHVPNTPISGFGDDAHRRMIEDLQFQFGNIKTDRQSRIGNQTLSRGTHSWQTVYNKIKAAAQNCVQVNAACDTRMGWGQYNTVGGLSNVNFAVFIDYLEMDRIDDTEVQYARYPHAVYTLAHAVEILVSYMSSSFNAAWNSWGFAGSYYPGYYMGGNYYGGDHLNIGFGYNGNGNWGISLGGGINF